MTHPIVEAARAMGWRIIDSSVIQDRDPGDEDVGREWTDSAQILSGTTPRAWRMASLKETP